MLANDTDPIEVLEVGLPVTFLRPLEPWVLLKEQPKELRILKKVDVCRSAKKKDPQNMYICIDVKPVFFKANFLI